MSLPRLCFLSYREIRQRARPIVEAYRDRALIEVVDGSFEQTLSLARERLARGSVDAFVSAGSNASLLRRHLQAPVATIQLGGFDILQALIEARPLSQRVGIVMYGETIPELESVKTLLNIEIHQHAYQTPADVRDCMARLRAQGVQVVVGSSLVVELARQDGLTGILAYSLASIRQGFEDALELARVARLEAERYAQLDGVLRHLQDAVLAVDPAGRVTAVNPAMLAVLQRPQAAVLGQTLSQLSPELSLDSTLRSGLEERGDVLRLGGRDWLVHRTPILAQDAVAGAALTLYDASNIHEGDNRLRMQQRQNQRGARYRFADLGGSSPAWLAALDEARRYAATAFSVLLQGETGTGKELVAQAIHHASDRAHRPFVAVNCSAFAEGLLESELFGHEEGAFTGARRGGRRGLFEAAHTGTLFLDEIGDMPLALQTRLLRVLQEREIYRLGASSPLPVDVRVIAATHQPLAQRVQQGQFREDLFYRLNTLNLQLPPLRERQGDIGVLAQQLLTARLRALSLPATPAHTQALLAPLLAALRAHHWPGNVRELENVMDRLAVSQLPPRRPLPDAAELIRSDLSAPGPAPRSPAGAAWQDRRAAPAGASGLPLDPSAPSARAAPSGLSEPLTAASPAQRAAEALARCGQHHGRAAQALGISRSTLWRWLRSA
ncbi:propionate catabolism operon regulatory protein PrpR [Curvibacter sp. HBC61]|uniref:Propionate catabolism operon regulatory protein PrpR n=1 Tax=Curvibacter cyanobacteriorum TaxID=3026422 RepID=A0ABT5MY71_9BURK|nr:propionate catabolism operon regulatory protein PrpR [Curvibacter sp. HBC61]MDD0837713.1 propionate catabolism operon regulatory protein PrpR [Curvibacter sp. HBC61]